MQIDAFGHHRDRRERVRLHDAVLLPAGEVHERAPERILVGVVRLDHDADAVRSDHLADRDAGHVVAALVEPAADRRIDAEVAHLEQRFAVAELRAPETSVASKHDSVTIPTGRFASTICRFVNAFARDAARRRS